jgi:predicted GNAT family N-acyltransferase
MFVEFIACKASETYELRQKILRPHQTLNEVEFSGDMDSDTYHCAAIVDGKIVGVASIYKEDLDEKHTAGKGWRIRGMCVEEDFRMRNYGLHLLGNLISHARSKGGEYIWCNARTGALGFYVTEEFEPISEEFQIEGIGAHVVVRKFL